MPQRATGSSDDLDTVMHERGFDAGAMNAGILPVIGDRRSMGPFGFDFHIGDTRQAFEQTYGGCADEVRAGCRAMALNGDNRAHGGPDD